MKRADLVTGVVLMLFALAVASEASRMPLQVGVTTGPGFLPLLLAVFIGILGATILISALRRPEGVDPAVTWPTGRGRFWIITIFAALLAYTFLVSVLGYVLPTFAFMLLVVLMLGSYRWYWSVAISLGIGIGLYVVFRVWLGMSLPTGFLIVP
jgi:putative tricarboxylic transport membrane protein